MAKKAASAAAAASGAASFSPAREGGLDGGRDPVDRVRLLDHRRVVELRRGRIDVTARRDHERNLLLAQPGRDRPDVLALEVHIEDGEVEPTFFHLFERALDRFAGAADLVAEGIEEILQHHCDEGFVLDDQNGAFVSHAIRIRCAPESAKSYFVPTARRAASASSVTEKGLGRKLTFSMSIDFLSCSSA
jgi:hypothetical protein